MAKKYSLTLSWKVVRIYVPLAESLGGRSNVCGRSRSIPIALTSLEDDEQYVREKFQRKKKRETKIQENARRHKVKMFDDKLQRQVKRIQEKHDRGDAITQKECDLAVGLCFATNEWLHVKFLLQLMKNNNLKKQQSTFRACLSESFNAGNGISALKVLEEMKDVKLIPDAEDVRLAVLALCRNNKDQPGIWKKALELLVQYAIDEDKRNKREVVSVIAYNAVLQCLAEDNYWEDSKELLEIMEQGLKVDSNTSHPIPNIATYYAVFNAMPNSSKVDQALDIILSMPGKGFAPTVYIFELLLSNLLKDCKLDKSVQLLDMMDNLKVIAPTVFYNKVISALGKAGQLRTATSLLSKMKNRRIGRDTVTFNSLISACANKGQSKEALRLLDECKREKGVEVDIITFTNTIRACAKGNMIKKALELLEEVKERDLPLDAYIYTSVINACTKVRMWRKALDLLEEMEKKGVLPNEFTYSAVITACGNGGQWERALGFLNEMREKRMKISTITYNAAIAALAKASRSNMRRSKSDFLSKDVDIGKSGPYNIEGGIDEEQLWRKALDLIEQMKKDQVWPDAYSYSAAIGACGSGGNFEQALSLIKVMQNGPKKSRPNKIAYTEAISACARSGEWAPAQRLFVDMKVDKIVCDTVTYNALLSAFMNGGKADMAYDFWNEMCSEMGKRNKNLSPDIVSLTSVIASLERKKRQGK